jgi:hypothetical protein
MLADPGFASFTKKEGDERLGKRDQTTMIRGGTKTYGKQKEPPLQSQPTSKSLLRPFQVHPNATQEDLTEPPFVGPSIYGRWVVCSRSQLHGSS